MGLKNTYQARKKFTKTPVSNTGMWYQNDPVVVPSNKITMKGPNGELDYFDSPIMGIGMQSGQKQIMQPGREYSFPNDNFVYERKMQSGGELALDAASFLPPPFGTAAGLGSAAINIGQGDWEGLGWDLAGIASGGAAKIFKGASKAAKVSGAGRVARSMDDKAKFFNVASNPNIYKTIGLGRDYDPINNQTAFGGYQDNAQITPVIRPIKPKMQTGGLYAVGPYDEMIAPKQGNYLLPDINRPSYLDEFGGMRSEYKMGFNDDGKEVLIPTVVQGKQLSEDEAVDNYYRTGLHMGKYDTVQDAENASALRTAKYNMLQDPVRFDMKQYQKGGISAYNKKYPPIYLTNPNDPRIGYYAEAGNQFLYKKPVQPVKYKDPKIVAKQQQLLEAGYNIGEADGIWGPKSQEAWDQMNASKQTTQTTSQTYQTPTIVVKDINEDKANTLRNQYQDSTGTAFKSKDQIFNSLQQSLKRKPTVKEYNDAVEQFNRANRSMEYGGWLKSYQNAGEVSTEQNPESIGQVHVRAKDKGWFDNYIKRPLRKFGRSYAQRISDATGGSEWYKQANPFMNLAFESMNAPQYAATYAVTGKVQTPSEAMNIQNPYGAFAVDAVLDPTNLLGAGLLKQPIKNLGRNIVSSPNNIGTAKLYDKALNLDSFLSEGLGELIAGRKNRKALSEGNTWLKNWIADPITQNKIENDLVWASQRQDQYGLGYQQAKSFVPNVREYPLSEQMKDFFIRKEGNIHAGNSGVSYLHHESPITRQRRLIDEQSGIAPGINMRYYGSWASRSPAIRQSVRKSNVIHEGTHDWTTNFLLNNSGQADAIKNLYSDKIKNISEQWQNLRKQGINPSQVMGEQKADLGYLADPTEVHARIMELRQLMKMTPEQSVMVTPEKAQDIIRRIENPKNAKFIDPKFLDVIDKDPKKLAALFNRLWAAPAATALGASQLEKKKNGGLQRSYLKTKKFK